jgi:hypothetical protein
MRNNLFPWFTRALFARCTAAALVLLLSLLVMPLYTHGDQIYYRRAYEGLSSLSLSKGYLFYSQCLGSTEYIHFYLSWVASRFVEKDLFIAFSNAIFAYAAMSLFQKWKVSVIIAFWLILTNFYFLVLYFAAERLKFGFIFLALSMIYIDQVKRFYVYAGLAVLSHLQTIIVYVSILSNVLIRYISKLFSTGQVAKLLLLFASLLLVSLLAWNPIMRKYQFYSSAYSFAELVRISVFLLFALLYSKNKSETFKLFVPLVISIFLVGGNRVNLFGYFVFLYYGVQYRGGWNFGVLATSAYFFYASIVFLANIFQHGDGFFSG